mmetsp:Transcript_18509/g.42242  ORF Transcript_18509/g.42242 Transcript_18509/m.42242 type:complete len:332 (-) Transcript_18509:325-1320(-)
MEQIKTESTAPHRPAPHHTCQPQPVSGLPRNWIGFIHSIGFRYFLFPYHQSSRNATAQPVSFLRSNPCPVPETGTGRALSLSRCSLSRYHERFQKKKEATPAAPARTSEEDTPAFEPPLEGSITAPVVGAVVGPSTTQPQGVCAAFCANRQIPFRSRVPFLPNSMSFWQEKIPCVGTLTKLPSTVEVLPGPQSVQYPAFGDSCSLPSTPPPAPPFCFSTAVVSSTRDPQHGPAAWLRTASQYSSPTKLPAKPAASNSAQDPELFPGMPMTLSGFDTPPGQMLHTVSGTAVASAPPVGALDGPSVFAPFPETGEVFAGLSMHPHGSRASSAK